MTTATDIRIDKASGQTLTTLGRWLRAPWLRLVRYARYRKQQRQALADYQHLAQMPNYILRDLGISRAELNVKLSKPFWWS